MTTKTWNFTLTPPDGPVTTREGLSHDEAIALVRELMYGRVEIEAGAETPELARAA